MEAPWSLSDWNNIFFIILKVRVGIQFNCFELEFFAGSSINPDSAYLPGQHVKIVIRQFPVGSRIQINSMTIGICLDIHQQIIPIIPRVHNTQPGRKNFKVLVSAARNIPGFISMFSGFA